MSELIATTPPISITYRSFRSVFRVISHIFFREIKTTDAHLVPKSGPCIFIVGPHANQFVDGIVFLSNNPRSSFAIMAAVSYDKPLIGHVGKILNASKENFYSAYYSTNFTN
jgi:1-acyl-sn-glycerol-3-phosphate acyltransferase